MLINVKMATIVGILTFMSTINSRLSCIEHEKSFITSGPVLINLVTLRVAVVMRNMAPTLINKKSQNLFDFDMQREI